MEKLAEAVVYTVTYINTREEGAGACLEDDVSVLESVAFMMQDASDAELDALAAAAKRALAEELATAHPRDTWVETYSAWMENLFGGDGWIGNDRA
jgi:tRNA(Ile)-lysidine synthase TilS/MesJ